MLTAYTLACKTHPKVALATTASGPTICPACQHGNNIGTLITLDDGYDRIEAWATDAEEDAIWQQPPKEQATP